MNATGGLRLADALKIHSAIHSPTTSSVTLSDGTSLPIFVSDKGARRCDVIVDAARPKGRCKLMAQNVNKDSAAAKRALAGSKITWILPLDSGGSHATPTQGWGMIENGVLKTHCKAVLNASDVAQARGGSAPPPKRQKVKEHAATAPPERVGAELVAPPVIVD